jgi:transposase
VSRNCGENMVKKGNRNYTAEFKEQAVRLAEEMESAYRAAKQLGIPEANVHNWQKKQKQGKLRDSKNNMSVVGSESAEEELKRLRKEVDELRKVNYILKKAAAFFSQDHLK